MPKYGESAVFNHARVKEIAYSCFLICPTYHSVDFMMLPTYVVLVPRHEESDGRDEEERDDTQDDAGIDVKDDDSVVVLGYMLEDKEDEEEADDCVVKYSLCSAP